MSTKRIVCNVFATYAQNFISLIVGLFSARWLYQALGEVQLGVFSVVGSLIAFVAILNGLLIASNVRFFALAIGKGNKEGKEVGMRELQKWFNTSLFVHVIIAIVFCVLGYPIGIYMIHHRLTIPPELVASSVHVFQISILLTALNILTNPYQSLFTAKQLIFVRNFLGILQTLLCAVESCWLLHFSGNRLVYHSILTSLILILLYGTMTVLAIRSFPECRIRFSDWMHKGRLKEFFSYSSITLLGSIASLVSGPGVNIVLNRTFGPAINAAMSVAHQVSAKLTILSDGIISSISPEITSRVGEGRMDRAMELCLDVCFLSVGVAALFYVPIVFWLRELLVVWLDKPPMGAAAFSLVIVAESLILKMTSGYQMLIHATGKIAAYQVTLSSVNMSCIVVVWIMIFFGYSASTSVAVGWLIPRAILSFGRVLFARKILQAPIRLFFQSILFPSLKLLLISILSSYLFHEVTSIWYLGFPLTVLGNVLILLPCIYFVSGTSRRERLRTLAMKAIQKIKRKVAA